MKARGLTNLSVTMKGFMEEEKAVQDSDSINQVDPQRQTTAKGTTAENRGTAKETSAKDKIVIRGKTVKDKTNKTRTYILVVTYHLTNISRLYTSTKFLSQHGGESVSWSRFLSFCRRMTKKIAFEISS